MTLRSFRGQETGTVPPCRSLQAEHHAATKARKMMDILSVTSSEDLAHVRTLFTEYAASLDIDFGFENFHKELFELPGD